MAVYEVEWIEVHCTRVEADSEEEARETAVQMNDTFDEVLGEIKLSIHKTYRVSWIEHHECEVDAVSKTQAFEDAEQYAGGHDTCGDSDSYEIMEMI